MRAVFGCDIRRVSEKSLRALFSCFKDGEVMRVALTVKEQAFINEYLVDLNATQAAIRAGYSVKDADKIGTVLLRNTRIKAAIDKAIFDLYRRL
jgi:hypothetical protein